MASRLILVACLVTGLATPAWAAVALRSTALTQGFVTTSATVTEPSGCTSGDWLIAISNTDGSGTTAGLPSGWTSLHANAYGDFSTVVVGYVARGGSAPSLVFTTGSANSRYLETHLFCFTGVDTSSPIGGTAAFGTGGTASAPTGPDPPSGDVGTDNYVIAGGYKTNGAATGGWGAPTGYAVISNNSSTAGSEEQVILGSTSTLTGTQNPGAPTNLASGNVDYWLGFTIGINESGGAAVVPRCTLIGVCP